VERMVRMQPLGCDFTLEAPERHRPWYESRGYEPMSTALFRTAAGAADVVLDIGAHVGYYTLVAASARPSATVVAVEASPANAEVLQRNVDAAGKGAVRVVAAAFGATTGRATIHLTEASDNNGLSGHPNSPTLGSVDVAAIQGSDLDLPPGRTLLVKLDVEGHELGALSGLEGTFARYDDVRLLVELNPKCATAAGSSADALVERLRAFGFRLFLVDEDGRTWQELRDGTGWADLMDPGGYANLYCVLRERCTTISAVIHSGGLSGAERSHTEIVESLVRQGCMVHTVVPGEDLGLRAELLRLGGSVTQVPPLPWWMHLPAERQDTREGWPTGAWVSPEVLGAIAGVGPDVVLTETGVIPQGALAAAALGLPHIWYLREFGDRDYGLSLPGGREAFGHVVRALSDRVVANSAAVRDHLVGGADDVTVLHPAPRVPVSEQGEGDAARQAARQAWTVGIVGSLNPGKGQADAVSAVALLRDEGVVARLVLVGPGTPDEYERLEQLARHHGVDDRVEIVAPQSDRAAMYARFDAVAVTSRSEAFGRVPFEATAVGLPVVYADAGGMVEYLRPGATGLSYPPGDAAGLAAAFRSLAADPGLGRRLARTAQDELLGSERHEEFDRAVLSLVTDAAARRAPAAPFRSFVGALVRGAADEAQAAARWRVEASATHDTLSRVVEEHESLVSRFHQIEADFRASFLEGTARATELDQSRANNARLRGEVAEGLERLERCEQAAAATSARVVDLESQLRLIRGSRTWRARDGAARLLLRLRPPRP